MTDATKTISPTIAKSAAIWSLTIPIVAPVLQAVSWMIIFPFATQEANRSSTTMQLMWTPICLIWFYIPLVAIIGLYLGLLPNANAGYRILGLFGCLLNLIYLAAFAFVFVLVFVIKVHV